MTPNLQGSGMRPAFGGRALQIISIECMGLGARGNAAKIFLTSSLVGSSLLANVRLPDDAGTEK
jgi:hypothetical protein